MKEKGFTREEFRKDLEQKIKTDPKIVAKYIDANNTLLVLSLFDKSVPVKYGLRLRKRIGRPKTVLLFAGHYSSVAYTQFVSLVPAAAVSPLPFDYIETEALQFYNEKFGRDKFTLKYLPIKIIKYPFELVIKLFDLIL